MGYAFLGHGGLELSPGGFPDGMGIVAIDAGTTIQVYSDTGQSLMISEEDFELFDKLDAPWDPLDSTKVITNLELTADDDDLEIEKGQPGFFARALAPHTPLLAGKELPAKIVMCNGTPETCPTDPRQVSGEKPGPRAHTCDGILGRYKGELHWLACTVVYSAPDDIEEAVETSLGTAPESVPIGIDPDDPVKSWYALEKDDASSIEGWFNDQNVTVQKALLADQYIFDWHNWSPKNPDYDAIKVIGKGNLDNMDENDTIDIRVGGGLVLVGDDDDYDPRAVAYRNRQKDKKEGTITLKKGAFGVIG